MEQIFRTDLNGMLVFARSFKPASRPQPRTLGCRSRSSAGSSPSWRRASASAVLRAWTSAAFVAKQAEHGTRRHWLAAGHSVPTRPHLTGLFPSNNVE
jgi:hypothetical protein